MNVFEKMGLKIISNRSIKSDNLVVSITGKDRSAKTINIYLSDKLIAELGWENVERVSLFSDGSRIMALTTPIENENTYKLSHISNNRGQNKKVVRFTWQSDIIEEPQCDRKANIQYETDLDEINDRFGIKMYLSSNLFEGV